MRDHVPRVLLFPLQIPLSLSTLLHADRIVASVHIMDNMYNYDYQFRLIVVGDSTVGKVSCYFDRDAFSSSLQSSLLRSFCDGVFSQDPVSFTALPSRRSHRLN